ncbi:unnamed protein product [Amoebophrya sp. A120]|nr:unnamed protein product [Amoebophrya sp. A120]|eukprot:GSA120T00026095001.1
MRNRNCVQLQTSVYLQTLFSSDRGATTRFLADLGFCDGKEYSRRRQLECSCTQRTVSVAHCKKHPGRRRSTNTRAATSCRRESEETRETTERTKNESARRKI